ncbi:MAG TPA: TonB family protein [Opitutaceae bacterium]|jgi:protein TonB|nr:TonB family protein [Opitutaceae bacterium]
MRRDLIIGFVFTITLEALIAWGGDITHFKAPPKVKDDTPTIQISMPKIEPDEPDVVEDQPQAPVDISPPMQNDMPQVVTPDSFVQPIEPPPPDLSAISKNIVKIPETRSGLGGVEVFDISKLDQQPVAKFQARPQFPFEMRRAGISGEVLVDFIVDTNGEVRNAFAAHSSQREFEAAAVQAVSKWKFRPGRKNGHAVFTHMQVPIVFTLNEDN